VSRSTRTSWWPCEPRGDALDFEFLFSDGLPFGGGSARLPIARRAGLIERTRMWVSGRRGPMVTYARHRE